MGATQSNEVKNYLPGNKIEDNSVHSKQILPLAAVGAGIVLLVAICGACYCFYKRSRKPPMGFAGQQPAMTCAPPVPNYPPNFGHSVMNERQFHPNMNTGSQMGSGNSFNNQYF